MDVARQTEESAAEVKLDCRRIEFALDRYQNPSRAGVDLLCPAQFGFVAVHNGNVAFM
jgi:hypothetical protein